MSKITFCFTQKQEEQRADEINAMPPPPSSNFPRKKDYYNLCFWNLPPVKCLDTLRKNFLEEVKNSLLPGSKSTIYEEKVNVFERDEKTLKWKKDKDTTGDPNVLILSYMFVPIKDLDEAKDLKEQWHHREYRGYKLSVFWSQYGRMPEH